MLSRALGLCTSLLLLVGAAHAQRVVISKSLPTSVSPGGTVGCGAGMDQSTCGDVADARPAAPASPIAILTCGQTLSSNTSYQVQADLLCGNSATMGALGGPNIVLDINGHRIQGQLTLGSNASGGHVYSSQAGDSWTCTFDSSSNSCVFGNSAFSAFNALLRLDHLTIQNTTANSTSSARAVFIDVASANSGTINQQANIQLDHLTIVSSQGLTSSRIIDAIVQGTAGANGAVLVAYNNKTTCKANAAACQGIEAYGLYNAKIHNNDGINELANASSSETPRAYMCESTGGCEISSNTIDAQDGRAVRMRVTSNTNDVNSIHDNEILNVKQGTNSNYVAAFHLGDSDCDYNGAPCATTENISLYSNTIGYTSGQIFMVRDANGIAITGNTINGSGSIGFVNERVLETDGGTVNTGTVNTSGTAVTLTGGINFTPAMVGNQIVIAGSSYPVAAYNSTSSITLGISAGTQSGASYSYGGIGNTSATVTGNTVGTGGGTLVVNCEAGATGSICPLPTAPSSAFTWVNIQNSTGNPGTWQQNLYQAGTTTVGFSSMSNGQSSVTGCPAPVSGSATLVSSGRAVGTVNTSGTNVTWVSGTPFQNNGQWDGNTLSINGTVYTISTVTSTTSMTLATSAGTQTGVAYQGNTAQNTLFYRHLGTSLGSNTLGGLSNATYDVYVCIPSGTTTTTLRNIEFDPDIYVGNNWGYKMSYQCDVQSGNWRTWNSAGNVWVTSPGGNTYTCSLFSGGTWVTNTWHHIQYYGTFDQTAHTYAYKSLVVDGTVVFSGQNFTYSAENNNDGNTFNAQFQVDGQNVNGTSFEAIDRLAITVW